MNTHFNHFRSVEPIQIPEVCGSEAKAHVCTVQGSIACCFWGFSSQPNHSAQSCIRSRNCHTLRGKQRLCCTGMLLMLSCTGTVQVLYCIQNLIKAAEHQDRMLTSSSGCSRGSSSGSCSRRSSGSW